MDVKWHIQEQDHDVRIEEKYMNNSKQAWINVMLKKSMMLFEFLECHIIDDK